MALFSFFFRSIRRRLATGLCVEFMLLGVSCAIAMWALIQHQQAIEQLEYLLERSPDRGRLESAITNILRPFHEVDIRQNGAVDLLRSQVQLRIDAATKEKDRFHRQSLDAERDPMFRSLGLGANSPLLSVTMAGLDREFSKLKLLAAAVDLRDISDPAQREYARTEVEKQVTLSISRMHRLLSRIPAPEETNVLTSLRKEKRYSERMQRWLGGVFIIALATYFVTIILWFRWISMPLRQAAQGASRIANGDFDYRLERLTCWDDEFHDLAANFNRMADRFQESQRDLSQQVEERSKQLVRSERLAGVGFLAAGVAHEINNPLQAMAMAAESVQLRLLNLLDPDDKDAQEIAERLKMIQRESKRCGQITRRLLDFARPEKQDKRKDDLTRVVGEVLAMVRPMKKYQNRRFVFEQTAPVFLEMNASEVKQVVLNLVSNALHATDDDGTIEIRIEEQTDTVVLSVRDDGHGMTEENIAHLFDPFYTTKETGVGTGLGLSITHRIIEDHGGTIDPRSEGPGKGSTFLVRLPKRQQNRQAA